MNLSAQELGQKRLEFASQCKTQEDWEKWEDSTGKFPFSFGKCWNHTTEYKVDNLASEAGFFIDVLGFDCNTISESYVMIMSPGKEFFFSFRPAKEGEDVTPPDALTLEFFLEGLSDTVNELKNRGIKFSQDYTPEEEGSPLATARFETPNGIPVRLWGFAQ